jgi:hypothetical protein
MTRLSWHLESLAWWCLFTGLLIVWCIAQTVWLGAVTCRRLGPWADRAATILIAACLVSFLAITVASC